MTMLEAARMGDKVAHTNALFGFIPGMVVGAIFAVGLALLFGATLATGGGALILAGALLAGAGGGALKGMSLGLGSKRGSGDPIKTGASKVTIGRDRKPAARARVDQTTCHTPKVIAQGSKLVTIQGHPAARRTDKTQCDGTIDEGCPTVFIGKEADLYVPIESEVPGWMVKTAQYALVVGTVLGLAGGVIMSGIAITAGGFIGGHYGSQYVGQLGGWIGFQLNGERGRQWGQAIGEEVGGVLGGAAGGWAGGRPRIQAAELALSRSVLAGRPALARSIARVSGESPTAIAARQQVAREHYNNTRPYNYDNVQSGYAREYPNAPPLTEAQARARYDYDISSNMAGINFRQPVYTREYKANTVLYTYNKPGGGNAGSYFTTQPERPTSIGISERVAVPDANAPGGTRLVDKEIYTVRLTRDVEGLVSTASPKYDTFSQGSQIRTNPDGSPMRNPDGTPQRVSNVADSAGGAQQININTARQGPTSQANTYEAQPGGVLRTTNDNAGNYRSDANQNLTINAPDYSGGAPIQGDRPYSPNTVVPGVNTGNMGSGAGAGAGNNGQGDGEGNKP